MIASSSTVEKFNPRHNEVSCQLLAYALNLVRDKVPVNLIYDYMICRETKRMVPAVSLTIGSHRIFFCESIYVDMILQFETTHHAKSVEFLEEIIPIAIESAELQQEMKKEIAKVIM